MITGSSNIPVFEVKTLVDLTAKPKLVITNLSTGAQTGAKFTFELYSPLDLPVHVGTFSPPDAVAPFTTFDITDLPAYNSQLEFGQYKLIAKVSEGSNIHTITRAIDIKRPAGNSPDSINNYGRAYLGLEVRCNNGKVFAEDRTPNSYSGVVGVLVSRKLQLYVPADGTGIIPIPKSTTLQNSTFDIPYNGNGYNLFLEVVYDYLVSENVYIRVKYKANECFEIACGIDLCKVLCAIDEFREEVACERDGEKVMKLLNANTLLTMIMVAKMQPNCGVDVQYLLKKISDLLNVDCSCNAGTGIGTDRDSVKNLAIQIYNITNIDNEVKNYFCQIGCDCVNIIGLTGDVHVGASTTAAPTTAAVTTSPGTTTHLTTVPPTTTVPATTTVQNNCKSYIIRVPNGQSTANVTYTNCNTNEVVHVNQSNSDAPLEICSTTFPTSTGGTIVVLDKGACSANNKIVIYGVANSRVLPTQDEIFNAAANHSLLVANNAAQIEADLRYNTVPKFPWVAELSTQPAKTLWDWDGPNLFENEGAIGGDIATTNNIFPDPGTVSIFRVYMTITATKNTTSSLVLKVNDL